MRKLLLIAVFIFMFAGLTFLLGQDVVEAIVAVVNDDVITLSQYKDQHEALYQMLRSQYQGEDFQKQYRAIRKDLLNTMITELLLYQEAKSRGYNVAEQIKLTIENIKEENGLNSDEELKRVLSQQGVDFEVWKRQMEENFMKQSVIVTDVDRSIVIEDSEIVKYHKQHPEEFIEPEEYKLKAIYIKGEGRTDDQVDTLKREISEKISAGEDFATLAGQYSEGPEKESQGDLGSFKKGELEKTLEQAVEKLEAGENTSWLTVRDGWYLLKLVEKKESRIKTFDEVRKEIEEKLFQEKRQKRLEDFLKELKEKSFIKILNPNPLDFD